MIDEPQNLQNIRYIKDSKYIEDCCQYLNIDEKMEEIAKENGIDDISYYFGKTLLLQVILSSMDKEEANEIMSDTLSMMQDGIEEYEVGDVKTIYNLDSIFGDIKTALEGI